MKILKTILFMSLGVFGNGQSLYPALWFDTGSEKQFELSFYERNKDEKLDAYRTGNKVFNKKNFINYNSSVLFSNIFFSIPIEKINLSECTILTVYQQSEKNIEKNIWSYEINGKSDIVLTTKRTADLGVARYFNYPDRVNFLPKINTYRQYKSEYIYENDEQIFRIGDAQNNDKLPSKSFEGHIAEILLFNKVIPPTELIKYQSYLSLKYGISLNQQTPTSYINSKKEIIWDAEKNKNFRYNITGIGRDDDLRLNQKQSTNCNNPKLLQIGLNKIKKSNFENDGNLNNFDFLIWSDNNLDLEVDEQILGLPDMLSRKWIVNSNGFSLKPDFELKFDISQLEQKMLPDEILWIIKNGEASSKFKEGNVDFYGSTIDFEKNEANFVGIKWDQDLSGKDLFSFAIGPKMIGKFWIENPICKSDKSGSISIGAEGGRPPYNFMLKEVSSGYEENWSLSNNKLKKIPEITQGDYILIIKDSDGNDFFESFFVNGEGAVQPNIDNEYFLPRSGLLSINGAKGLDSDLDQLSFEWLKPSGESVFSTKIEIDMPGQYTLLIDNNGCLSKKVFEVKTFVKDNILSADLFPNPSYDGHFNLRVRLEEIEDIDLIIYDISGKILQNSKLRGNNYYQYSGKINGSGEFIITLKSNKSIKSLPIIID